MYVENDPVVLAHARALLTSNETGATEYIDADLRDAPAILAQAAKLLDFTRNGARNSAAATRAGPLFGARWVASRKTSPRVLRVG